MTFIKGIYYSVLGFIRRNTLLFAIGVIVALIAAYQISNRGDDNTNILTVSRSTFKQQVSVSGTVVASSNVDMSFDQSGRIAGVYAKVGDKVEKGTILVNTENGDLRASLLQAQAALQSEQAKLQSLLDGTRPEELAVAQSSVDSATASLAQANQAVQNAMTDAYTKSDDAIRAKVDKFITNPKSSTPQLSFNINNLQLATNIGNERLAVENILNEWSSTNTGAVLNGDLSVANKILANLSLIQKLLDDSSSALNNTGPTSALSQTTLDGYKSDILTARTNINTAVSSLTSAITTQKSSAATLVTANKNLTLQKAGATQSDIDAESAKVKAASADVEASAARLQKTMIVAPFTGIVTKMEAKVGEIATPATALVSMIGGDVYQIESYIPEINVVYIKVGDSADVKLDAYGDTPFKANIVSIDPAETKRDGVSTYKTVLQFTGADERIRSGMTANITITSKEEPNSIVVPKGAIRDSNGNKVVMLKQGKNFVEQKITIGDQSSLGQVLVTDGLKEGDQVQLGVSTQ